MSIFVNVFSWIYSLTNIDIFSKFIYVKNKPQILVKMVMEYTGRNALIIFIFINVIFLQTNIKIRCIVHLNDKYKIKLFYIIKFTIVKL